MPFHCAAYPLAYNGEKYFLVDTESPGIGQGSMSKESLDLARTRAREHFDVLSVSSALLQVLYTMIISSIMQKSQEAMDALSEEDRKQLDDLLSKSDGEEEEEKETESEEVVEEVADKEE